MAIKEKEFTTKQAANFLGLNPQTLHNWRHRGKGPRYFKKGKYKNSDVVYKQSDLTKFKKSYFDTEIMVDPTGT